MGKDKPGQRTKNNARPSNSSRSAELLGDNFITFSSEDETYIPILRGLSLRLPNDIETSNIDPSFQIILKRMTKRDSTTRYKALQEFTNRCEIAELSIVKGMLPYWPRIYCTLAIDIDHKVREAAQTAHAAIVKRVGKYITICLKELAGAWFTSQYDIYAPAASIATNAFNTTFPPWKLINAIVHCQNEILLYINQNIIEHTAHTLSQAQRSLTREEMETKYQRVVKSNLQGYSFYFKKIPFSEISETALETHNKILSNSKFWKLAKHDTLSIKTAFFNVLSSIMENETKLLNNENERTLNTIINSLDETEPVLLSAIWESMLLAINKIDNWYLIIDFDKNVLPKLWNILKSGGYSCASVIYPNLLPFITQFSELHVNSDEIYMEFFNNMREGLSAESVQQSNSERRAITKSFMECLRYSINENLKNWDLCFNLFLKQLMPIIETSLTSNICMKHCLFEIAHLIRFWSKNRGKSKSYLQLITLFWIELQILFNKLDALQHTADSVKTLQIQFLIILKIATDQPPKKVKLVVSSISSKSKSSCSRKIKIKEVDMDISFNVDFQEFINALCVTYVQKINDGSIKYIEYLSKLINEFGNEILYVKLLQSFKTGTNLINFLNNNLLPLLLQDSYIFNIFILISYFFQYMNEKEKGDILSSLMNYNHLETRKHITYHLLTPAIKNDPLFLKEGRESYITNTLIETATEIASQPQNLLDINKNLILLAFEPLKNGQLIVDDEAANDIVSIFCGALDNKQIIISTEFITFITKLMKSIWSLEETLTSGIQILETLFKFSVYRNDPLTAVTRNSWKVGLVMSSTKLLYSEFNDIIEGFAIIIWNALFDARNSHLNDVLIDLATDILEIITDNVDVKTENITEVISLFMMASDIEMWVAKVTGAVIYGEIVTGNLCVSNLKSNILIFKNCLTIDITKEISLENIEKCLLWVVFTAKLIDNLYSRLHTSYKKSAKCLQKKDSDFEFHFPIITEELINIMYVTNIVELCNKHYKSTKYYNNVKKLFDLLQNSNLQKLLRKSCDNILAYLIKTDVSYGYMLPYIIRTYLICTNNSLLYTPYINFVQNYKNLERQDIHKEERYVQFIQILNNYCKIEDSILLYNEIYTFAASKIDVHFKEDNFAIIMDKIISYKEDCGLLLLNHDISDIPWVRLLLPLEIIRLLVSFIQKIPSKLTHEHWDFILISLTMWQESIYKSKHNYGDIKLIALITTVNQLYCAIQNLMNKHEQQPMSELPPTLLDEWKNVFAIDIYKKIIKTLKFCTKLYNEDTELAIQFVIASEYFGRAISMFDKDILFNKKNDTKIINLNKMFGFTLTLLSSSTINIQLSGYYALKCLTLELVQHDKVLIDSENLEPSDLYIEKLKKILLKTEEVVNTMLMKFKLCEAISCTIESFTDSYTYVLGYLLLWTIILDMCANASGNLWIQYIEILRSDRFPCLLDNIFKLMPVKALQDCSNPNKNPKLMDMFTDLPLKFEESWAEYKLDNIVCSLYTNSLRRLSVLVRQWWSTTDSKVSATIDKITANYVSHILSQEELLDRKLVSTNDIKIKVYPTPRLVIATHHMDNVKFQLDIELPENYPLGAVTVTQHASDNLDMKNTNVQLSMFLTHQNGSIRDAIMLWKQHLDKKFAHVEECYICFSILNPSTLEVPKLLCQTCRKKFHTFCLYKWFSTSQKSACPLCRNIF